MECHWAVLTDGWSAEPRVAYLEFHWVALREQRKAEQTAEHWAALLVPEWAEMWVAWTADQWALYWVGLKAAQLVAPTAVK